MSHALFRMIEPVTLNESLCRWCVLGIILLALGTPWLPRAGASYSELVVFGDSLSDVGNVRQRTFGIAGASPYFDGRFTNGPNYVDFLAENLALAPPSHSVSGGSIYAHGGARVRINGGTSALFTDSLRMQADDYLLRQTVPLSPETLFVVFGGANDVRIPSSSAADAAHDLVGIVRDLLAAGASTVVVPNLPDVGLSPEVTEFGGGAGAASTARTLEFNATLDAGLNALDQERLVEVDVFTLMDDIVADAQAGGATFGITNAVDDCWEGGPDGAGIGGSYPTCQAPDEYLFWDILHPTTAAHAVFAQAMFDQIIAHDRGGDFNGDGSYDCLDADALVAAIAVGPQEPIFDVNGDGSVDEADLASWLAIAGDRNLGGGAAYRIGDANLDGVVDASDFNAWNGNKFQTVAAWCSGDFNADGSVDASDFNLWNGNKFQAAAILPEPAGYTVAIGVLVWRVGDRRRARRG